MHALSRDGHTFYWRRSPKTPNGKNSTGDHQEAVNSVVLVNGSFQDMNGWRPFEKCYSQHLDVILCDLPGYGSAGVYRGGSVDFLADCLLDVITSAEGKTKQVLIVGSSYGSAISYRFGQKYPERAHGMFLYGMGSTLPKDVARQLHESFELLRRNDYDRFSRRVLKLLCSNKKEIKNKGYTQKAMLKALELKKSETTKQQWIENSNLLMFSKPFQLHPVPTGFPFVFCTGEHDSFTPVPDAQWLVDSIRKAGGTASLVVIKGCDHLTQFQALKTLLRESTKFILQHSSPAMHMSKL